MERTPHRASPMHFGLLLKVRREQWEIKQREVLSYLPGWTSANYSRLESGFIAPAFENLLIIYKALNLAGLHWTAADRRDFIDLARQRIEVKKTHHQRRSDDEWAELYYQLTLIDPALEEASDQDAPLEPQGAETRHLVGREAWLEAMVQAIQKAPTKKLLVIQGPMGIGKSSELHRLARQVLHADHPVSQVIWLPLRPVERSGDPVSALEQFLSTLLSEMGEALPPTALPPLDTCISFVLTSLAHRHPATVIFLDNAEGILTPDGRLTACWDHFLERFLRSEHCATLVLATKEWPGWAGRERVFVMEATVPPLTIDASMLLLQRLGLEQVPLPQLRAISERVGGVPLGLEWVAALAQDPLLLDDWESFERGEEPTLTQRVQHLLDTPALLQGHFATKLEPLLERIIEQRLSPEAQRIVQMLAVVPLPLGQPALKALCEHPRPFKELRDASLLVAYPSRVQLLPMVVAAVLHRLTPEQIQEAETHLIMALTKWLKEGTLTAREGGNIVAELIALHLKHHHLVDAAQQLIVYGWMSFNQGHARRLAQLAQQILNEMDWHRTAEMECADFAISSILFPFLGKPFDPGDYVDYFRVHNALLNNNTALPVEVEGYVTQLLMQQALNEQHFEEAQTILDTYLAHLEAHDMGYMKESTSVIQKRAWLLTVWCEYVEEQGDTQLAQTLRKQAIDIYQQCERLLSREQEETFPYGDIYKRRLANCLTYLGFHLNRIGQYEEALQTIERAIVLHEQGYAHVGALASSYGEKSQTLMELGRFREALMFDEKALTEVQRCADAGDTSSQEEVWIYKVNRGKLYLRLGRVNEAEQLLQEAKQHIHPRRNMYRVFAEEALEEIKQWREQATSPTYQLDWRWIERYRKLVSYDSYWWLTWAGSFTEEEQQQWDRLFIPPVDDAMKEQLAPLLKQSRERELEAALSEQREPRLWYPAIEIDEVRRRITDLQQLDAEIEHEEANAIVRRLYHGAIEEEVDFLRLIEATYEENAERFWEFMLRSFLLPTAEEMDYALTRVKNMLIRGFKRPETTGISQRLETFIQTHLHFTFDPSSNENDQQQVLLPLPQSEQEISAQGAKRFFGAILRDSGYDGWSVIIDHNATNARIEQGLRRIFLPDQRFSLGEIRHLLSHELLGHVSRCVAGERSLVGLLGISTKNSASIEEGLALYHERQVASLHGQPFNDSGIANGTLATGLASGVITSPQTFLPLCTFFELFSTLSRLLRYPNADLQEIQKEAREYALLMCLRTYRGVPDLERAGICNLQDATHLHGLRLIEQAVAQDESILDRLAVGVVSLELLSDLQELGIDSALQPFRKLAYDPDLDSYILSFENKESKKKLI